MSTVLAAKSTKLLRVGDAIFHSSLRITRLMKKKDGTLFLLVDWKHCNTCGSEGLAAGAAVNCGSAHDDHMSTICEVSKNSDSDEAITMVLIKETNAQARCRRVRTKRVRLRYI